MAQFIKVEAIDNPQTLIPVAEIAGITATANLGVDSTVTIALANGSSTYAILVEYDGGQSFLNALIESFNKAIVANPGGIVSTVVPPIQVEQVPAPQSGEQGRIVVATPAKYAQFKSVTFTA